jgi:hypothetical protein
LRPTTDPRQTAADDGALPTMELTDSRPGRLNEDDFDGLQATVRIGQPDYKD